MTAKKPATPKTTHSWLQISGAVSVCHQCGIFKREGIAQDGRFHYTEYLDLQDDHFIMTTKAGECTGAK